MPELVADGIYQVRLPLPFALNSVNCYLLRGASGWTLVDTGINTEAGRETWRNTFDELNIKITDLEKIVLTHAHPDHFGLGGWLQNLAVEAKHHLPVYMSSRETMPFWANKEQREFTDYLAITGVTHDVIDKVADSMVHTMNMTRPDISDLEQIHPGDTLQMGERTFQAIHTPGHSDGHLIFYDANDRLALSGDHVLMKITPNIGLWSWTDENPLDDFLTSLNSLQMLDVRLALPGHKNLITDWQGRLTELHDHHLMRLQTTLEAVEKGLSTAYQAAHHIFEPSRFTVHEWRFAVAETLAHLEYLRYRGQIIRETGEVWRYSL